MNKTIVGSEAAKPSVALRYPEDLDITVYGDGRWRYAASFPDDIGSFREVFLHPLESGGWGIRLQEHVGSEEFQGETERRWKDGLEVESLGSGPMSYEVARGATEVWLRGGRIIAAA
ncbi:hypothetical protein D3C71_451640 [compost metagenome]